MDIYCSRCGEPWDIDTVLRESPEEFERMQSLITRCPACPEDPKQISEKAKKRRAFLHVLSDVMGDDIDDFASECENLENSGILDD
ncbi:hypothetical protein GF336_00720 [Candidatus Woesearchaeota archaeon]|nr:hypothetical protein [Candidatus Woesearchaeota archaeon]